MSIRLSHVFLACLVLTGCNYVGQNNPSRPRYQRFVPVPREGAPANIPWSGAFALDTMTGQLCWTYKPITSDNNAQLPTLPDCKALYQNDTD